MLVRQKDVYTRLSPFAKKFVIVLIKMGFKPAQISRLVKDVSLDRAIKIRKEFEESKIPVDLSVAKSIILRRK